MKHSSIKPWLRYLLMLAAVIGMDVLATRAAEHALVADHLEGRMCCDENCPGCRAYFEACDGSCDWPPSERFSQPDIPLGPTQTPSPEYDQLPSPGDPSNAGQPSLDFDTSPPSPAALPSGLGALAAASSAAPNMMGDLFGVGTPLTVELQGPEFTPAAVQVTFAPTTERLTFSPSEGVFGESTPVVDAPNLYFINQSSSEPSLPATDFSGPLPGMPLTPVASEPNILIAEPVPGTFVELTNDDASYQDDVEQYVLSQRFGLESQQQDYIADNGPGTFDEPTLETASIGRTVATLNEADPNYPNDITSDSLFYIEQEVIYDAGTIEFQPDAVMPDPILVTIPSLGGAPGANVGRQKLTENSSPIPRDRLINNFSYFHNTPLRAGGQNVTRNVVGFEKTCLDGLASFELRAPFASTLDSTAVATPTGDLLGGTGGEFGNMTLYLKTLVYGTRSFAVGAGLGVAFPTADDFFVQDENGTRLLGVENESAHLLPYLGLVYIPNSRTFIQGMVQLDVDTRGNEVSLTNFSTITGLPTGSLVPIGRAKDADYLFVDIGVGHWLFRNTRRGARGITGIAPTIEFHYNGDVDNADALDTGFVVTSAQNSFDLVNTVVGGIVEMGQNTQLSFGYATPIGGDEQFDGEFRFNFNWYFGAGPRTPVF